MRNREIPKSILLWLRKNQHMIDTFFMEDDGYGESEGHDYSIWVHFVPGYINTSTETHMIHEYLVKDFMYAAGTIEKCDCESCKQEAKLQ